MLTESIAQGEPIRINTNWRYLNRAIRLGFREFRLFGPEAPIQCQDEAGRSYLWALLSEEDAIAPRENAIRISSSSGEVGSALSSQPRAKRGRRMTQRQSQDNSATSTSGANGEQPAGLDQVLAQAEVVKASLRDSLGKTTALIASLRRHRKQSRLIKSTLASLRQLQSLDAK